jgi:hypothetical protein
MALGGTFANKVILNPGAMAQLLKGPTGPVYRDLQVKGARVLAQARIECPKSAAGPSVPNDRRRGRKRQPGDLARSQVMRNGSYNGEPAVFVGTQDPIGAFVHEGTVPHLILPKNGKHLVFYWGRAGRVVYLKQVHHPGSKPNRWLIRSLRVLGR